MPLEPSTNLPAPSKTSVMNCDMCNQPMQSDTKLNGEIVHVCWDCFNTVREYPYVR